MKIVRDEGSFDPLQATFAFIQMAHLAGVLRRNGFDEETTSRVCGEYFNIAGRFIDQGWLVLRDVDFPELHGKRFFPELAFSERSVEPGEGIGDIQTLYLPEYATMLEDYTSGNLDELASWNVAVDESFECDPPIELSDED
jgi:hypothetical protein